MSSDYIRDPTVKHLCGRYENASDSRDWVTSPTLQPVFFCDCDDFLHQAKQSFSGLPGLPKWSNSAWGELSYDGALCRPGPDLSAH